LRNLAREALNQYELEVRDVRLLTNEFNGIFRVDTFGGEKYVLRISRPNEHKVSEILSEMMWLAALRKDTDLIVPHPLKTRSGELVVTAEVEGVPEPRHCVIFGWVPGNNLSKQLTTVNLFKLGEFAARLHQHGAEFKPPVGFGINRYDQVFPFGEPVVLFDNEFGRLISDEQRLLFRNAVDTIQNVIDDLFTGNRGPGVIHADLHQWNVRQFRGKLGAIDFEDLMWGFPVQDIAISFYYLQRREDYEELISAYKMGYQTCLNWPEQYQGQIDLFIAARGLDLLNYVLQDKDPEWQEQAPAFVSRNVQRLRQLGI
jgi:Ser/Thr protein kinase RdoA (MazF antagonist)